MNAPVDPSRLAQVSLDDKYTLGKGRVFLTGTQALVRLPMLQRERDLAAGLNTAGFVTGYRGSADARAAVQKNEVQYTTESQPSFQAAVMPTMVKTGMVVPIMYYDYDNGEKYGPAGELAKNIPAPTFSELYRKIKGKEPSGPIFEAFRAVNRSAGMVQRLFVAPAGTPKAALEALRKGIAGVEKDPGYRAEAEKSLKFVPDYIIGDDAEKLVKQSIQTTPEVISFLRTYLAKVQPKKRPCAGGAAALPATPPDTGNTAMYDSLIHGLVLVVQWPAIGYLVAAVLLGLCLARCPALSAGGGRTSATARGCCTPGRGLAPARFSLPPPEISAPLRRISSGCPEISLCVHKLSRAKP